MQGFELNTFRHRMRYDDGVVEIVNLLKEEWRPAPEIGSHIEIFWQDDNIKSFFLEDSSKEAIKP